MPTFYTAHTLTLAANPVELGPLPTLALLFTGLASVWINFDCDDQKLRFRASGGKLKIWGRDAEMIEATYTTESGEVKQSLLLLSGWWGIRYAP